MIETTTIRRCDRCKRAIGPAAPDDPATSDLEVISGWNHDHSGEFPDLCSACRTTVANLFDRIFKRKQPKGSP